jgi:hypothetical protein
MTHPFQLVLLWVLGIQIATFQTPVVHFPRPQVPPFFVQVFFDVYFAIVQAFVPVQLLLVVLPAFEQVPAAVQLLWLL